MPGCFQSGQQHPLLGGCDPQRHLAHERGGALAPGRRSGRGGWHSWILRTVEQSFYIREYSTAIHQIQATKETAA
jgi:hypothetical protein